MEESEIRNRAGDMLKLNHDGTRWQMRLYSKMRLRCDFPANDCQVFFNCGRNIEQLASDWERCESNIARIAINKEALETAELMRDVSHGTACREYMEFLKTARPQTIAELTASVMRKYPREGGYTVRRFNVTGREVQVKGYLSVYEENNIEAVGWRFDEEGRLVIAY